MAGKIMNADIQSEAELISKGASAAQLPNDDKVYVTANSINKTLKNAIIDGDIGGGGGGGGGKNYLPNGGNFNSAITGWSVFNTTFTGGIPGTITAGSTKVSLTYSTSNPLAGAGSGLFQVTTAAASAGHGIITDVMTIDDIDLGAVMQFIAGYRTTAGSSNLDFSGTSTQTLEWWIYNVGNAAWTQPSRFRGMNSKDIPAKVMGEFQSDISDASNKNQYRLAMIVRNDAAGTASVQLDNLYFGSVSSDVGIIPKAPTIQKFTSGSGTYTTPAGVKYLKVRMVGGGGGGGPSGTSGGSAGTAGNASTFGTSLLTANGGAAGGGLSTTNGGAGGTATINSPAFGTALTGGAGGGGSLNSTSGASIVSGTGGNSFFGGGGSSAYGANGGAGATNTGGGGGGGGGASASGVYTGVGGGAGGFIDAIIPDPVGSYSYSVASTAAGGGAAASGFSGGIGAGGYIEVEEHYLGTNVQFSNDTDTRVVAMKVSQATPTATITSTPSKMTFTTTPTFDTHNAFSTGTGNYTCPVSGYYRAAVSAFVTAASAAVSSNAIVGISKNNAAPVNAGVSLVSVVNDTVRQPVHEDIIYCNAGDTLAPFISSTMTTPSFFGSATFTYFMVERLSGPSQIAASENVSARYETAAGQAITGAGEIVDFGTKVWDSHSSVSVGAAWKFTAPISGEYEISYNFRYGSNTFTVNTPVYGRLYKNGVGAQVFGLTVVSFATTTDLWSADGVTKIKLLAGDFVQLYAHHGEGTDRSLITSAANNWIEVSRTGNY